MNTMTLYLKPGDLLDEQEFEEFRNILDSREEGASFYVDLAETKEMNLAKFTTLIRLYVSLRRAGKTLKYSNLNTPLKRLVSKTNFHHVFPE